MLSLDTVCHNERRLVDCCTSTSSIQPNHTTNKSVIRALSSPPWTYLGTASPGILIIAYDTGPCDKPSPPATACASAACANMTRLVSTFDHSLSPRAICFGVGSDSEWCGFVLVSPSLPPPQAARGIPLTQRRALTAAMLDSYAERCNDMTFSINLDELDGPIAVHLMVME